LDASITTLPSTDVVIAHHDIAIIGIVVSISMTLVVIKRCCCCGCVGY